MLFCGCDTRCDLPDGPLVCEQCESYLTYQCEPKLENETCFDAYDICSHCISELPDNCLVCSPCLDCKCFLCDVSGLASVRLRKFSHHDESRKVYNSYKGYYRALWVAMCDRCYQYQEKDRWYCGRGEWDAVDGFKTPPEPAPKACFSDI